MAFEKYKIIKKLLGDSRWIAFLAVLVLYISSGLLVLIGLVKLYGIIYELYIQLKNPILIDTILFSSNFIIIIEIYLLAIVFFIFAIGIYKLFIGEFSLFRWLNIEHIDDLKSHIAKSIVLFLSTLMVQKISEWQKPEELLYLGATTSLTAGILIWYILALNKKRENGSNKNRNKNNVLK